MDQNRCTAGFARLDITPPLGVRLRGYYNIREADAVADPLYVNAVAFGQGECAAVVLVCDLLGIYNDIAFEWPVQIARELGLDPRSVFLCHTHSHTGPVVGSDLREVNDPMYDAWLLRRLKDAAQLALKDRKPVTDVQWAQRLPGHTFVRRFYMKDGHFQTWGDPQDIDRPGCDGDDSLRLIRIVREGGKEIALVNFQLHPDCMGGTAWSADYPGAFRDRVEQVRGDVCCVYLDGAEGQLIASNRMDPLWQPKPKGHSSAVKVGRDLADHMLPMFEQTLSTGQTGLSFDQHIARARTKRDPARMPEAERLIALHEAGRDREIGPFWMATPLVAEAYVLRRLEAENRDYVDLRVSAITFCGMALLGLPGEPFCEVGQHIRSSSKFPVTCVCCQTNGSEGYYPIAEAYDQGGYEPRNTRFLKGTAELLMDTADRLLESL